METLTQCAKDIIQGNLRHGPNGSYTIPAKTLYPFQWNWDSCFAALGLAHIDEGMAWSELKTLFSGQWENGMVPHIIFHEHSDTYFPGPDIWDAFAQNGTATSGISQPPIVAFAIRKLYEHSNNKENCISVIQELAPKLYAFHKWYHTYRNDPKTGLVYILHPWESGRDNSPEWDEPLSAVDTSDVMPYTRKDSELVDGSERPTNKEYDQYVAILSTLKAKGYAPQINDRDISFRVIDVGINAILLRANKDLLWLIEETSLVQDASWSDKAQQLRAWIRQLEQGFEQLWNGTQYCGLDMITDTLIEYKTSASLLPLFAGVKKKAFIESAKHYLNTLSSEGVRLVPSLSPHERDFDPRKYWRGPCWLVLNYMIYCGLSDQRLTAEAGQVKRDSLVLVEKSGFREYFDPQSGEGLGGDHFTWTAAIYLAFN